MSDDYSNEIWKAVVGYEGIYSVSNTGRIRRDCRGKRTHVGRILTPHVNMHGYFLIDLYRDKTRKTRQVHSLVVEAFIGERIAGREVNHKNGIKADNRIENLEYVTRSENQLHALYVTGKKRPLRGERHPMNKLTQSDVDRIRHIYQSKTATSRQLAARYKVSQVTITNVCNGKTWAQDSR